MMLPPGGLLKKCLWCLPGEGAEIFYKMRLVVIAGVIGSFRKTISFREMIEQVP